MVNENILKDVDARKEMSPTKPLDFFNPNKLEDILEASYLLVH